MTGRARGQPGIAAPDLADERIAHIVRGVARAFQTSLERRLAAHGVGFGFWVYLRVLWAEDGLSQRTLSDRVGLTGPTTHAVVKRMEAAGLVELKPVVAGKPRRVVRLSEEGRRLQHVLEPLAEEVNDLARQGLTTAEQSALRDSLLRLYDNLTNDDGTPG